MNLTRAYLIVPKLIEQPTWGGTYIAKTKGWKSSPLSKKNIGQSYELYAESQLSYATDSSDKDFIPDMNGTAPHSFSLESLMFEHPESILGTKAIEQFGNTIKTLIKFTQAKGNSFQLHIKPGTHHERWRAKPESWYFLEDGCATVGVSDVNTIDAYKIACVTIERYMTSLSDHVVNGRMTVAEATEKAQAFIHGQKLYDYVNKVTIPKHTVVDLHEGGTHHSWEEDDDSYPEGNVLYEVQVDERDDASTIRSFDKGKFMEDGTTRPLHIDDYFTFIDRSPDANDPSRFMKKPRVIHTDGELAVSEIFTTPYYSMQQLDIHKHIAGGYADTHRETFHHLFVMEGIVGYTDPNCTVVVRKGHSLFVPACTGPYELTPMKGECSVLKTFV